MTYQSIRNRIASVVPSLSESHLDWATPLAVGAATGLGASAFNVVSPWDIDPVTAGLASGGATYLMGRGRMASKLDDVIAAPPKDDVSPRVAIDSTVAPNNPTTGQLSVVVPSLNEPILPWASTGNNGTRIAEPINYLERNLAKATRLDPTRVESLINPQSLSHSPKFVEQLSQEGLSDKYLSSLAFPEDVVREHLESGVIDRMPPIYNSHNLAIHRDEFVSNPHKLNSEMLVIQPSKLGRGNSYLVDSGYVPDGTKHPNVMTSSINSLERMASPNYSPTPEDKGFFAYNKAEGRHYPTELGYDYNHAQQIYNSLPDFHGNY